MTTDPIALAEKLEIAAVSIDNDATLSQVGPSAELVREAAQALRALAAPTPASGEQMEVVAWRVKDYADGWFVTGHQVAMERNSVNGNLVQPLVTLDAAQKALSQALKRRG